MRLGDRYDDLEEIARGGMGVIYRAYDRALKRQVAIKRLQSISPGEGANHHGLLGILPPLPPGWTPDTNPETQRFLREAYTLARLEHPGIPPIYDISEAPGFGHYFAMKLINGRTLHEIIHTGPDVTLVGMLEVFLKVLDAIGYAHSQRVIHRDLKPANVMVGEYGESLVLDWGLARIVTGIDLASGGGDGAPARAIHEQTPTDEAGDDPKCIPEAIEDPLSTLDGQVMGTPAYMAPEQARGEIENLDRRSDIYSLGAILYEILTLEPPFGGSPPEEITRDVTEGRLVKPSERSPTRNIPNELEAAALKAMAYEKERRYRDARELRADIEAYLSGNTLAAVRYPWWVVLWKWAKREKARAMAGVVCFVVALSCALLYVQRESFQREVAARELAAAEKERQAAERERDEAILAHARIALPRDPTEATALLKRLSPDSALEPAARALARDAENAGVAQLLGRHDADVTTLAWAADGRSLASGHSDGEVRIWDVAGGPGVRLAGDGHRVYHVAWSDGQLATAGEGGIVRLWTGSGEWRTLGEPGPAIRHVAWALDGMNLAASRKDGAVEVFKVDTGVSEEALRHDGESRDVAWSPDGRSLASAGRDGKVLVWDKDAGVRLAGTHEGEVMRVAWSPHDRLLASAGRDRAVRVFREDGGRWLEHRALRGHEDVVWAIEWSPVEGRLASASADGTVRLWDPAGGGASEIVLRFGDDALALDWSPDGRTLAASGADGTVHLLELETRAERILRGHRDPVLCVAFAPDGESVASGGYDGGIRVWKRGNPSARVVCLHSGPVWSARWSPDGRLVATCSMDGSVSIVDGGSGRPFRPAGGSLPPSAPPWAALWHEAEVAHTAWSPDGRRLASAGADRRIGILDLASGETRYLEGHQHWVEHLAWSPDGASLASAGADRRIGLWSVVGSGAPAWLDGHEKEVTHVAFSPNGRTLASSSRDGTIRLWDVTSARELRILGQPGPSPVWQVEWSPHGGEWLAACDWNGRIRLFDPGSDEERTLEIHRGPCLHIAWSPLEDDARLASAGHDGTVSLIDARMGTTLARLAAGAPIHRVAWSRDGQRIAAAGEDGVVRVFELETGAARRLIGHSDSVEDVAFSPDGRVLASTGKDRVLRFWREEDLAGTGLPLPRLLESLTNAVIGPDGRLDSSGPRGR